MAREPDEEERRAFRDAVRGVQPLRVPARAAPRTRPKPKPRAVFRRRDDAAVLEDSLALSAADLEIETGEELFFRRPGVQDGVMRKLRRGQYQVGAVVDLHGLTMPEAKRELREFLVRSIDRGDRCVRVIHGKGLRSGPRGPVLKIAVNLVLRKNSAVLAFCSARQVDGGTGAIQVLLSQ